MGGRGFHLTARSVFAGVLCAASAALARSGPQPEDISSEIQSADPSQRQAAVDAIWREADHAPREVAVRFEAIADILLQNQQYDDVEALALLTILTRPFDVWSVGAAQKVKVDALLAQGKSDQALVAAKSYFNVAVFSQTQDAADVLAKAIEKARGAVAADEFRKAQTNSVFAATKTQGKNLDLVAVLGDAVQSSRVPPPADDVQMLLASIHVDPTLYQKAINDTRGGSPHAFYNLMAQGSLLLLADQPADAKHSFEAAVQSSNNNEQMAAALAGIGRALRASDGRCGTTASFLIALQGDKGAVDAASVLPGHPNPQRITGAATTALAAEAVDEHPSASTNAALMPTLPTSSATEFRLPVAEPLLISRLCPQADPKLREWLDLWQRDFLVGHAIDDGRRSELRKILEASPLPPDVLSKLINAYVADSDDSETAATLLTVLPPPSEPKLRAWLAHRQIGVAADATVTDEDRKELAAILREGHLSRDALYAIGHTYYNLAPDPLTTAVFYAACVERAHKDLSLATAYNDETRSILQTMKNCERTFWIALDDREPKYEDDIYLLSCDIEKWVPPGDSALGWMVAWAQVGEAECLYEKGDTNDALSTIARIDRRRLNTEQQAGVAWIEGLVLVRAGRYGNAAAPLTYLAAHPEYPHGLDALRLLFDSGLQSGNLEQAQHALTMILAHHLFTPDIEAELQAKLDAAVTHTTTNPSLPGPAGSRPP